MLTVEAGPVAEPATLRWWTSYRLRLVDPAAAVDRAGEVALPTVSWPGWSYAVTGLRAALLSNDPTGRNRAVAALVGLGPGLTPAGDDLLAGALVGLRAAGDPTADAWALTVRAHRHQTTPLSGAMLDRAADGWCCPELATFLTALDTGRDQGAATRRLLAVGHTSGAAYAKGATVALLGRAGG